MPAATREYQLIVVGGGVAGSEAATACASAGLDTLLVTTSLDTIYALAHDRFELEPPAGTLMARLLGEGRQLVAAQALRSEAKYALEDLATLHLLQSSVTGLVTGGGGLRGIATWEGVDRFAPRVALCAGSFLEARLRIGDLIETAGRLSEMAYDDLYQDLCGRGFEFEGVVLELPAQEGVLPYTVRCKRLRATEVGADGFSLTRFPGLFGAGVCVRGGLCYEEAAADGYALGQAVVAAVQAHP